MPRPHPDPDPDGFWPSCDDPQPGVSIRPLNYADLAALLTHLDHDHDHDPGNTLNSKVPAPVLAMRVRASVGRPGASAYAEYRRRRAPSWPPGPTACPGGSPPSSSSPSLPGCWPTRSFPTWRPWLAPS
jgi:hypothetical protein